MAEAIERSGEIKKIENDLRKLSNAARYLGRMAQNNNKANADLADLAAEYSCSVIIPQEDFAQKMGALNENIDPSIKSLSSKISHCVDKLNELLEKYRAQQEAYENQQNQQNQSSSGN